MGEEKFKDILNQILNENTITQLEQARTEMKEHMNSTTPIAIILVLMPLVMMVIVVFLKEAVKDGSSIIPYIVLGIVVLVSWSIALYKTLSKIGEEDIYNEVFQDRLIKPLVESVYETYTYIPEKGITSENFAETGIYVYNQYNTSQLTCGTILNYYQFEMANVQANREHYNMSNDVNAGYTEVIFDGLLIKIKLQNTFQDYIYLTDEKSFEKTWKNNEIQLNKEQFGEKYILYSDDIDLAKKIFSNNMIQELLEYYNITKKKCEIVIKEQYIYLMFPNTHMFGNIILYDNKEQMYKELYEQYKRMNLALELSNTIIKSIKDAEA